VISDRNLAQGLFLVAISLMFGLPALQYRIGTFERAGPGLFPLLVSSLLLIIGIATIIRARYLERVEIDFNFKNIAIITASLCGFALVSEQLNMIAGIIFMVFFASLAARTYSVIRNAKICAGLVAVAFVFQKLLGFNLPLY